MYLQYYLEQLNYSKIPEFLSKYLETPALLRLKKVGYFCGMDYASKNIYSFREYISRYDHSLTVCLLTHKLTKNKTMALAGLFHDIATPCFSHVIDYMNKDYEKQESTEEYTEKILKNDEYLQKCLKEDNIKIEDIIDFKKYTVVDSERPKLCADRIDGIILTGIGWTKNLELEDIKEIIEDLKIVKNEENEEEIGFATLDVAKKVMNISKIIDSYCHSNEDNYMMELLAEITKIAIDREYIKYEDLYTYNEEELFELFKSKKDLEELMTKFKSIRKEEITDINLPMIKSRRITPMVNNERLK